MGTSDDIKYLQSEREKLWEEVSKLKSLFNEIEQLKEQIKKQTPEQIESVISKTSNIDTLYSKINETNGLIATQAEEVTAALQSINDNVVQSNDATKKTKQLRDQSDKHTQAIETSLDDINAMLTDASKVKTSLDAVIIDIQAKSQKLQDIETINETSGELAEKISLAYTNVDKYFKEIANLHIKVFGYTKKDEKGEDLKIKGLKDDLEQAYTKLTSELSNLRENIQDSIDESSESCLTVQKFWESQHDALVKQISALLPTALTAGLSYAYNEKKEAELKSMEISNATFGKAIAGLVGVSMIPFATSLYLLINGNALESVILKLPNLVMAILPLYIPVLWIAYSSSKKVNLSKRLIEEYAHKEALSKTFEGLSGQINNIKDSEEKDELKAKLLYNLLEVSAENPGKLIYDYNNADHPLMDALDKSVKLGEAIIRLENIPGLSKVSNMLVEKNKKIKQEIEEKANDGLETIKNK